MEKASTFVGLDEHQESIDVTIAEAGRAREVRHRGTIGGHLESVAGMLRRLRRRARALRFVYEAGPCACEIYLFLCECGATQTAAGASTRFDRKLRGPGLPGRVLPMEGLQVTRI